MLTSSRGTTRGDSSCAEDNIPKPQAACTVDSCFEVERTLRPLEMNEKLQGTPAIRGNCECDTVGVNTSQHVLDCGNDCRWNALRMSVKIMESIWKPPVKY